MDTHEEVALPAGGDNIFKAQKSAVSKKTYEVQSKVLNQQKRLS